MARSAGGGISVWGKHNRTFLGSIWPEVIAAAVCDAKQMVAGFDRFGRVVEMSLRADDLSESAKAVANRSLTEVELATFEAGLAR